MYYTVYNVHSCWELALNKVADSWLFSTNVRSSCFFYYTPKLGKDGGNQKKVKRGKV